MVKDFRYIIKRIIIGVGIALTLSFLRGNFVLGVNALEINSYNTGGATGNVNSQSTGFGFTVNGSPWANWGAGYLYFNFSLSKYSGNSTSTIVTPRSAYATSGGTTYVCSIGTTSNNNSTWNTLVYSARCPMTMASDGLTYVYVRLFESRTGSDIGSYEYSIAGQMTYEQAESVNVNVDTSGTTNAINNQINNDNQNTQSIINSQNNTTNAINGVNDTLKNDNVNSNTGNNFFSNFKSDNHGLSGIITAPLRLINSITSSTCSSLSLPLPFVKQNAVLPCMSTVYNQFPTFYNLWQLITTGIVSYWVIVRIFGHIKGMQNPNDDRIEVFEL